MKINERDALNISKPYSDGPYETPKANGSSLSAARPSESAADAIDVRSQGQFLTMALEAGSEERSSRLEQLRALVQSGAYQVDTAALSRATVSAALNGY